MKKDGSRQTTLFGLTPGQQSEKKAKNKKTEVVKPAMAIDDDSQPITESIPSTLIKPAEDETQTQTSDEAHTQVTFDSQGQTETQSVRRP